MADGFTDRIEAWLRMRDVARFNRDARSAADSVEDIGDEAEHASAKLALMNKEAKRSRPAMDGLGISVNNVSGRMKIFGALALITAVPLVEIAGSASQAALGFGLLGAAAGGAAVVGLSGLIATTGIALSGITKIRSAQNAYNLALQEGGKWSDAAVAAQQKLNDVIAVNGGKSVMRFLDAWDQLKKSFQSRTVSARKSALGGFLDLIKAGDRLLPTFTSETNKNASALRRALRPVLAAFSGPEAIQGIRIFGKAFRQMLGPVTSGGADLVVSLLRYVVAATPYLKSIAKSFERWAGALLITSANTEHVHAQVKNLVGQLRSWWGLATALFGLMYHLLSNSAAGGQNLVDKLTAVVLQIDNWVQSLNSGDFEGWNKLFYSIAQSVGMLSYAILQVVQAALPGLQSGSQGVNVVLGIFLLRLQVLTDVLRFLGPLVGPIVIAFAAWRVATIALTVATTLLGIALRLTPLGWIVTGIGLVIAAVILMYNHFAWFRDGVNAVWGAIKTAFNVTFEFIKRHWGLIASILLGPFGLVGSAIIKHFEAIKNVFRGVMNWVISKWNNFGIHFGGIKKFGQTIVPGFNIDTPDIPLLATGGVISPGGTAVVGDEGPELATVDHAGRTTITPLSRGRSGGMIDGVIHVHATTVVEVDKREIGRATADATADWKARKGQSQ
jgi:hypothetical protein